MISLYFLVNLIGALGISAEDNLSVSKPLLVFEADEGFPKSLIGAHMGDIAGLDKKLDNIRDSLTALTPKYDVAILIYPTHLYDRNAFGGDSSKPINRVHPALIHTFKYFDDYGGDGCRIKIMLEAYSSGIATSQNGEIASVPLAPLNSDPNDPGRSGWAMDVDALSAIKDAFPEVFLGIRFHEIYGSDMVWKLRHSHGFPLDPDVGKAAVDACKCKGLMLLWSDSNWLMKSSANSKKPLFVYDRENPPYFEAEPYCTLQNYAEDQLKGMVCFSWANNNFHFTQNLEFLDRKIGPSKPGIERPLPDWFYFSMPFKEFPLKNRKDAKWGMSIQSWFWHEYTNSMNGRYFRLGENDCPIEIMQAYVLKGLREGASVLQFEPSWYLFNENLSYAEDSPEAYERTPDFSERLALKRLKETLLDPQNESNPPSRLDAIFDRDQQRFHENCGSNPPKSFRQSVLTIICDVLGNTMSFDFYSYGPRWRRLDKFRYDNRLFSGRIAGVHRIELQGNGVDEILILGENESGRPSVRFYNQNSGSMPHRVELKIAAEHEELVGLTTANLISETVVEGDPDEIVAAINRDGSIRFVVYKAERMPNSRFDIKYSPLPDYESDELIMKHIGKTSIDACDFAQIVGIRSNAVIYEGFTRSLDRLALVTHCDNHSCIEINSGNGIISGTLPKGAIVPIDIDLNHHDEICVLARRDGLQCLDMYAIGPDAIEHMETHTISADFEGSHLAVGLRKCILLNGGSAITDND